MYKRGTAVPGVGFACVLQQISGVPPALGLLIIYVVVVVPPTVVLEEILADKASCTLEGRGPQFYQEVRVELVGVQQSRSRV